MLRTAKRRGRALSPMKRSVTPERFAYSAIVSAISPVSIVSTCAPQFFVRDMFSFSLALAVPPALAVPTYSARNVSPLPLHILAAARITRSLLGDAERHTRITFPVSFVNSIVLQSLFSTGIATDQ